MVMLTPETRLRLILLSVGLVLLVPLVAMLFTDEVNWSVFDFVIMGGLLLGTALLCELVLRRFKSLISRIIICGFVLFLLFLVWVELAVGIFGSPFAGS
jgi:hypothetical protein